MQISDKTCLTWHRFGNIKVIVLPEIYYIDSKRNYDFDM